MELRARLKESLLFTDGGMGTMLQGRGLKPGENPAVMNMTHPEVVQDVHKRYLDAGSDVVFTNTFRVNELLCAALPYTAEALVDAAVTAARAAASGYGALVALDIGPLGSLMQPMGSVSFAQAYELFRTLVRRGAAAGADMICIETMADIGEARAAVMAAKENSDLFTCCTMSFEKNGRTFMGHSIPAMALTLASAGADMLGFNCSLGPKEMIAMVRELADWTALPIAVKPNAGMPVMQNGETVYTVGPEAFAQSMLAMRSLGVNAMGGCCGTDPSYIRALRLAAGDALCPREKAAQAVEDLAAQYGCSASTVEKNDAPTAVLDVDAYADMEDLVEDALDEDAPVLTLTGTDEARMAEAITLLQGRQRKPLRLLCEDPAVYAALKRVYVGRLCR